MDAKVDRLRDNVAWDFDDLFSCLLMVPDNNLGILKASLHTTFPPFPTIVDVSCFLFFKFKSRRWKQPNPQNHRNLDLVDLSCISSVQVWVKMNDPKPTHARFEMQSTLLWSSCLRVFNKNLQALCSLLCLAWSSARQTCEPRTVKRCVVLGGEDMHVWTTTFDRINHVDTMIMDGHNLGWAAHLTLTFLCQHQTRLNGRFFDAMKLPAQQFFFRRIAVLLMASISIEPTEESHRRHIHQKW